MSCKHDKDVMCIQFSIFSIELKNYFKDKRLCFVVTSWNPLSTIVEIAFRIMIGVIRSYFLKTVPFSIRLSRCCVVLCSDLRTYSLYTNLAVMRQRAPCSAVGRKSTKKRALIELAMLK